MKLISMTDFVEWIKFENPDNYTSEDFNDGVKGKYNRICNYANFLNQPLTLGMFVPCDEDGNVLEEPENYESWERGDLLLKTWDQDDTVYRDYQKAKERVFFKGFEMNELGIFKDDVCIYHKDTGFLLSQNIEDLSRYFEITLTQSALKQIGLTK